MLGWGKSLPASRVSNKGSSMAEMEEEAPVAVPFLFLQEIGQLSGDISLVGETGIRGGRQEKGKGGKGSTDFQPSSSHAWEG